MGQWVGGEKGRASTTKDGVAAAADASTSVGGRGKPQQDGAVRVGSDPKWQSVTATGGVSRWDHLLTLCANSDEENRTGRWRNF